MNRPSKSHALRPGVVAARLAMLSLCTLAGAGPAFAEDPVDALTHPSSTVEVGVGSTSDAASKAHEYDGLVRKGPFLLGNFDLRGGGAWDSDDASRWRVFGQNLGTESFTLGFESGVQGKGRFSIVLDELKRNGSDTYRTPLLGAGTDVLTLPSNWIVPVVPRVNGSSANARGLSSDVTGSSALVAGVLTKPTAAQLAQAAALQAADLPAFNGVSLGTRRSKIDVAALVNIDRRWDATANFRHEERVGLKAMSALSAFTGGDISTIVPDPIDQDHDQVTLGLNYTGERLVLQGSYYLSTLTNNVPSLSWSNWAAPGNTQTMSSAPSNQVHQFSLNGNFRFDAITKLSGSVTYGRASQNDSFLQDASTPLLPATSAHALVQTKAVNFKLSSRPLRSLNLAAAYKYDDRDNLTPVNNYAFYDAGTIASGVSPFSSVYPGLGSNVNINANRPYSKKLNQVDLDADYTVVRGQVVRVGYTGQKIDRWCNGTWIACVDADSSKENTLHAEYIFKAIESFNARLGLAHSARTVDYNEDAFLALVPMANVSPTGAPGGATAYGTLTALGYTGYGPLLGLNPLPAAGSAAAYFFPNNNALDNNSYANRNRISELPGMRRYNMADRKRDKVRSSLNWQANESLSLQGTLDANRDDYDHSVYGLQSARSWVGDIDAVYSAGDNTSVSVFATYEDQKSTSAGNSYTANSTATAVGGFTAISGGCYSTIALRNANNKIDPCLNWSSLVHDKVATLGLSATRKNLADGKLDVVGGLSYSAARTANDVAGGNYVNNPLAVAGAPAGTSAAFYIPGTALPDVTTKTIELRLGAKWKLDDSRSLRLGYLYQHMSSVDWAYDGLQFGGLAGILPSLQQAPNYTVHTVTVSYIYNFQ